MATCEGCSYTHADLTVTERTMNGDTKDLCDLCDTPQGQEAAFKNRQAYLAIRQMNFLH